MRLIDADALLRDIEKYHVSDGKFQHWVQIQPTIEPEPEWIPWDSGRLPEESGTYTVTAYDGVTNRVTYAKYQKRLKRWELTGARAYWRVLAWMPLPEPYCPNCGARMES